MYLLMFLMFFTWKVVEVTYVEGCGKVKMASNMVLVFIIIMKLFFMSQTQIINKTYIG